MNMFRNLLILFLMVFGFALVFSDPNNWSFIQRAGPQAVDFLKICATFKPFVIIACFTVALALFMTKKVY